MNQLLFYVVILALFLAVLYLENRKHNSNLGRLSLRIHGNVILTVIDNGKGFVGDVENIWKVGFSSKNSTGLGMPYVLEVVEKYGGTVKAGNRLDGGARFVITLPEVNGYE